MLIVHGNIKTMAERDFADGYIEIRDGKIAALGEMKDCPQTKGRVLDVEGSLVMPGIIEAHCHMGITEEKKGMEGDDCNENVNPITPYLRAIDAINPMDAAFRDAMQAGITSAMIGPGSANVVGGQFAFVKTHGRCIDHMIVKAPAAMKVAFGENPKVNYSGQGTSPSTRMAIAAMLREELSKAAAYRNKKEQDPDMDTDFRYECWLPVLYGLTAMYGDDPEDLAKVDIWNEALWYQCNPSLGTHLSLRTLRLEARAAKKSEAGEKLFRWLRLNQWIAVKAVGWLPLTLYDKTQWGPSKKAEREAWVRERLAGKTCYGGLDMSKTTDLTALTLLFPPQAGLDTWVALFRAWRPRDTVLEAERRDHVPYQDWERAGFLTLCEGDMVDYRDVTAAVLEAAKLYDLQALGLDQHLTQTITPALQDAGILVMAIPQTMMGMSPAMKELEQLIRRREMLHVHNTCARWNFGNVRCAVDGNENIKPMKNHSTGRIDIAVAWIIAMAAAMQRRSAKPDLAQAMRTRHYHL